MTWLSGLLWVEQVDEHNWRLLAPIRFMRPDGTAIVVPKGFVTDFASVPRALPALFVLLGEKGRRAAVVHDYLYRVTKWMPKDVCDKIFYEALLEEPDCPKWAALLMYEGVRLFGAHAYNHYRKEN